MNCDYLIVGAGFSGLVLAERLCAAGKTCVVIDRRSHFGGNSDDHLDENGVRIHTYGPHYFRTDSPEIIDYLSRFTQWLPCTYRVMSWTEGRYWSFPVNLATYEQLVGHAADEDEFKAWLEDQKIPIPHPANSEEAVLALAGRRLYELFFRGYTRKQWKRDPSELDASVCSRIPIRTNRNDAYLREKYQMIPRDGYHTVFENLIAACGDRLTLLLNTDYRAVAKDITCKHLFYSGPIDEYYQFRFGPLPYRSLRFEAQYFTPAELESRLAISGKRGFWQPCMQVNYPNDYDFTRIVEIKHATQQDCAGSTIVREYPADCTPGSEPYYPVPNEESAALYEQYRKLAEGDRGVTFVGRLGQYRYCNMDQVVAQALVLAAHTLASE